MKRLFVGVSVIGAVAVLAGCPIFPSNQDYRVCTGSSCYDCPDNTYSSSCVPWQCSTNTDCGDGYVCGQDNACHAATGDDASGPETCTVPSACGAGLTCGMDGLCHTQDCVSVGCVSPYICKLANGSASCVASQPPGDDSGSDATTDDGGGDSATDGGGGDAADANDAAVVVACNLDTDCAANNFCVDGACTARANLCADGTECRVGGFSCVEGRCTAHCDINTPCAAGYGCNFNLGVCDLDPQVCTTSAQCQGGTVCVEGHCAAPCVQSDAGAMCPATQVCVNGGCIPDEAAVFPCTNDGAEGALANSCATGNVCVHHSCYVDCGNGGNALCTGTQSMCKQVTIAQGTFSVCGTATDLGSDCNPQTGAECQNAGTCVDGYCK